MPSRDEGVPSKGPASVTGVEQLACPTGSAGALCENAARTFWPRRIGAGACTLAMCCTSSKQACRSRRTAPNSTPRRARRPRAACASALVGAAIERSARASASRGSVDKRFRCSDGGSFARIRPDGPARTRWGDLVDAWIRSTGRVLEARAGDSVTLRTATLRSPSASSRLVAFHPPRDCATRSEGDRGEPTASRRPTTFESGCGGCVATRRDRVIYSTPLSRRIENASTVRRQESDDSRSSSPSIQCRSASVSMSKVGSVTLERSPRRSAMRRV